MLQNRDHSSQSSWQLLDFFKAIEKDKIFKEEDCVN